MTMMKRGQGQGDSDIMMILYSMIMISFIEWIFRNIPIVAVSATEFIKPHVNTWIAERQKALVPKMLMDQVQQNPLKPLNSITLIRNYGSDSKGKSSDETNPLIEKVDAVLDYICTLDAARHIRMDTRVTLNTERDISLCSKSDLTAKIQQITSTSENRTEILLTSRDLSVSAIRAWIDEIHEGFVAEKNNKLGNKLYYFDEIGGAPPLQMDMSISGGSKQSYKWESMPRALTFSMTEFKTNKSFSNVYGHHVDELKERLDLFLNHPEWYKARGLPHTLSCLLSGVTGAGKSSTFKALINDTKRHPFVVRLRPYTTQQQLKNLFFNETVVVQGPDGQKQTLKIPLHKRFILFEDIDCSSDVVLDREMFPMRPAPEGDAVTLDFLLNLLDGILERPNCLVGASANFVERLDRALIRPGRFDVRIHFGYVDLSYLRDMFGRFYELSGVALDALDFTESMAGLFTPAEVIESMCNHYKIPEAALNQLKGKMIDKQRVAMASDPLASADDSCPPVLTHDPHTRVSPSLLAGVLPEVAGGDSCPHDPSLLAGAPRGLPDVAGAPGVPGDLPRVAGAPEKQIAFIGQSHDEIKKFITTTIPEKYIYNGVEWECNQRHGFDHHQAFRYCSVCDPKIAQLDKEHNTVLSRDNLPQINGEQKLRQMINEAAQIKAHHAGGASAYDSCPPVLTHDPHTRVSPSLLAEAPRDLPDVAEAPRDYDSCPHDPHTRVSPSLLAQVPGELSVAFLRPGVFPASVTSKLPEPLFVQLTPEERNRQAQVFDKQLLERQQQPSIPTTGPQAPTSYPSMFASFSGGSDDLWSNPMFEDAKPPPGAPPFDISMFAGSVRAPTNLNPI